MQFEVIHVLGRSFSLSQLTYTCVHMTAACGGCGVCPLLIQCPISYYTVTQANIYPIGVNLKLYFITASALIYLLSGV